MNFYGAKELAESFRTVRRNTIKIAEEIGEEHYGFRAAPETRSVAELLIHISNIMKLSEQIHEVQKLKTLEGFNFMALFVPLMEDEKVPHDKAEILARLQAGYDHFGTWLEGLTDEFLGEIVSMPAGAVPASKTRFEMLLGVKEHEMHHRGQLMMLQRMTGGVPHLTRAMMERFAAMAAKV